MLAFRDRRSSGISGRQGLHRSTADSTLNKDVESLHFCRQDCGARPGVRSLGGRTSSRQTNYGSCVSSIKSDFFPVSAAELLKTRDAVAHGE
jgi:hypothetical protein